MRVDYISDLHLDFYLKEMNPGNKLNAQIKKLADSLNLHGGEVLIIAGDLGHYFVQDSSWLLYMKQLYNNVLVVYGNHDFYLVSNRQVDKYKKSTNRIIEMKEFCSLNNINYLDGNSVTINDIKFSGIGMSWDKSFIENLRGREISDEYVLNKFNQIMNDSRLIYDGKKFDPFIFFNTELNKFKNIQKTDVMITHYGPCTPPNMHPEYRLSEMSTFFYFNGIKQLDNLTPKFWIYGHTHTRADYQKNCTRLLCNPVGYPNENFDSKVHSFDIGE